VSESHFGNLSASVARRLLPALWLSLALGSGPAAADPVISFEDDADVPHALNFGTLLVSAGSLLDVALGELALEESVVFGAVQEDIDAAHRRADGMFIISTATSSTVDGTLYTSGDLILVDPDTGAGSEFFDESSFDGLANVNAFFLFEDGPDAGKLLLSTASSASLGGLEDFGPGDLVLYDPDTDTATLFFDQDLITGTAAQQTIDAVHVFPTGLLVLSFLRSGGTLAGLSLDKEDLVAYSPSTGAASVQFDGEGLYNGITANLNAATYEALARIPALETRGRIALALALALAGLGRARRRR
jgi:hypothetical protein